MSRLSSVFFIEDAAGGKQAYMDEQRKLLHVKGLTQQSRMASMLCASARNNSDLDDAYLQAGREVSAVRI